MRKTERELVVLVALVALLVGVCLFHMARREEGASIEAEDSAARAMSSQSVPELRDAGSAPKPGSSHDGRARGAYVVDLALSIPPGDVADVYSQLKPLAEAGDHGASISLFVKIMSCWRAKNWLRDDESTGMAPRDDAGALEIDEECVRVTDEQLASSVRLIERAAAAGRVEAQILYASNPGDVFSGSTSRALENAERIVEFKKNASGYLRNSAARGSVDAMVELAQIYRYGRLGAKRPVEGYAYYYAANKAAPGDDVMQYRYGNIADFEQGLSGEQLQRGRTQGEALYRACCAR